VEAELEHGGGAAVVTLARDHLLLASEAYYTQVLELVVRLHRDGERLLLALHGRAALPGLAARLAARRGLDIVQLPPEAVAAGAMAAAPQLLAQGAGSVCLALPRPGGAATPPVATPADRAVAEQPTHVLHAGRAYVISATPLVVGRAPAEPRSLAVAGPPEGLSRRHCSIVLEAGNALLIDHSRHGTFLNGTRVTGRALLAAGDSLRLGVPGAVLDLVAVK
jgi:hypothetical protein